MTTPPQQPPAPQSEKPTASQECGAEDWPVWADGTFDQVICTLPTGHEGSHEGRIGTRAWRFSEDARHV